MSGDVRGRKRRDRPAVPIWTPAFAGEGNYDFAGDGEFFAEIRRNLSRESGNPDMAFA